MSVITPDLGELFAYGRGAPGEANGVGETIPPDQLAQLLQQQQNQIAPPGQPQLPPQLIEALTARLHQGGQQPGGQGWSGPTILPDAATMQQPLDPASMGTIANTSGYAGPLRQSDVPSAQIGVPQRPEQIAQDQFGANLFSSGPNNGGAGGPDQQEMQLMMRMAATMKQQGLPQSVAEGVLEKRFPWIRAQKQADLQEKKQTESEYRRNNAPAPAGIYLDKSGVPYQQPPIYGGDIQPGTTLYKMGTPQQKLFEANSTVVGHVDETLKQLKGVATGDRNKFSQYLKTQMRLLENNPEINTLENFLSPATALAIGSIYAAGGSSMKNGPQLAQMFKKGVYAPTDTLATTLHNMETLLNLTAGTSKRNNMHPGVQKEIQDRIDTIHDLLKTASGKTPTAAGTTPSKPGTATPKWEDAGGVRFYRE